MPANLANSKGLQRLPAVALAGLLVASTAFSTSCRVRAAEPKDPPPPAEEKPKGPDHNITLAEEQGVVDLLKKAQKARDKAQTDPSVWPECVKYYAEILKKYPNSVYLDKWEGPEKALIKDPDNPDNDPFKNGLYKSTRERVAQDIASLPRGGLEIYRAVNDPPAKQLFQEAQERVDERKMEQVAVDYASTSVGVPAMMWLAEVSYDSGARRQSIARVDRVLKDEAAKPLSSGLLIRKVLAFIQLGEAGAAQNALKDLKAAAADPANGPVRAGHLEGEKALASLTERVAAITDGGVRVSVNPNDASNRSWDTYFGNAAHNRVVPPRSSVGVSRWSVSLNQLLYGPGADAPGNETVTNPQTGQPFTEIPTLNNQLVAHEGYFYLCDSSMVVAYPVGLPVPGVPSVGGNAKFVFPTDQDTSGVRRRQRQAQQQQGMGIYQHPYFVTIANERLFMVCGGDPTAMDPNMWRGMEQKQPSNYLVALGRQRTGGSVESGKLFWKLSPDSPTFLSHSKADQDWLKSMYFTSAPTYENGVLYVGAVHIGGTNEAWVAAFDAESGRMLWHTMICAATPIFVAGVVQPDVGLPVTVANGVVYTCTNLGAVAALDALGGTIKWIRIYNRVKLPQGRWAGDQSALPSEFWGPNPPIVYKNLLIVTPQDSDMLYAYHIDDGKTDKGTPYEMGQRQYHIDRVKKTDTSEAGLKHVLGIVNGNLCITGTRVHFFDAWSGKISGAGDSISTDSPIFGRGAVTENMALVPTERSLVRIDATLAKESGEKDKFTAKVRDEFKWNPKHEKEEAGNIFIAGDVLYTVSHTHVNAFFVWEEMERKLKDRLTAEPGDLASYVELAGVYFRVEHFEDALSTLEKGEAEAEKVKTDTKAANYLSQMRTQRFETLKSLGQKSEGEKAYGYFKRAYETAKLPEVGKELPVIALNLMAENAIARGDAATAVQHYQEIVAKYGDVVYAFVAGSSARARLYAQGRIEEIRRKTPDAYAKFDAEATAALAKAGGDVTALENVIATYPNAGASLQALLKLAQVSLAIDPDRARQNARRYLNRVGNTPESVAGLALLAASLERSRMLAAAKDTLYRIAERTDAANVKLDFDPLNPDAKLAAPQTAKEWATARLADKLYQGSPTAAIYAMGKERPKAAWSRQAGAQSQPVVMHGMIPQDMRRNLFYIENQTELSVISGREGGDDLWQPRPRLPANCRPIVYWADRMMVLYGDSEVVALDSKDKGKVVWRYTLRATLQLPPEISPDAQKIVITYPSGTLSVLDASSGSELWFAQLEGAMAVPPALGDGCVAVAVGNPIKVIMYDLETQAKRGVIDATSGLSAGPVIYGDRMYLADHGNKIRTFDTRTGKLVWEAQCDSEVRGFYPTRTLLFAITPATEKMKVRAFKTEAEGDHASWWLDLSGAVTDIHADADDLYVVVAEPGKSGGRATKLKSYSIPKGGKFQWETDAASEFAGQLSVPENLITARHLVLTQSNWDPTGAKASAVVLVDRRTGKLTWDQTLASDPTLNADGSHGSYAVQLFDGGLAVCEARKRTAYVSAEGESLGNDTKALDDKYQKNPDDPELALRWARAQYDAGEHEKALGALTKVLGGNAALTDDKFSQVYDIFAKMRRDHAIKTKATLKFTKLSKAPKLDGSLDDWKSVTEQKFDSWRDVYLTSEQVPGAASRKASWKGADDLSVSFRGGYDDKNIYVLLIVKDDKHKNDQAEGQLIDLGDSALLMFDANNDGGVAFRGEEFSLGGGLTKAGAPVGWRWVEHGKFLTGRTPIENGVFAARNEAEKTTVYQFALPLESLALKAEPGKQFGFSFAVLDQDQEDGTPEKAVGSSPGVLSPPEPRLFSKGEFSK